jgi:hypothetical protein
MAAPKGNINALGNSGGKSLQDRKLAAQVRSLALEKIKELLEMPPVKMKADDYELYKAVLIKLAGSILPRLNEVTGEDGEPIKHSITGIKIIKPDGVDVPALTETISSVGVSDGSDNE